jgi:hypothetical protein
MWVLFLPVAVMNVNAIRKEADVQAVAEAATAGSVWSAPNPTEP